MAFAKKLNMEQEKLQFQSERTHQNRHADQAALQHYACYQL